MQTTLRNWKHMILIRLCVKEHSAVLLSETHSAYIYLNESHPLLFDNCAKPYHDYSLIWINRASVG